MSATAESKSTQPKKAAKEVHLPSVDELPEADIVIYDGKCNFCRGGVEKVRWLDGKQRFAYISLHDERVKDLAPELTHEMMMDQMYIVTRDGRVYGGADAAKYLTRKLPMLWIFAPAMHIPFFGPVYRWGYKMVARNRYLIAGKKEDDGCEDGYCKIHFDK